MNIRASEKGSLDVGLALGERVVPARLAACALLDRTLCLRRSRHFPQLQRGSGRHVNSSAVPAATSEPASCPGPHPPNSLQASEATALRTIPRSWTNVCHLPASLIIALTVSTDVEHASAPGLESALGPGSLPPLQYEGFEPSPYDHSDARADIFQVCMFVLRSVSALYH